MTGVDLIKTLKKIAGGRCGMLDWAEYNCCPQCTGKAAIANTALKSISEADSDNEEGEET